MRRAVSSTPWQESPAGILSERRTIEDVMLRELDAVFETGVLRPLGLMVRGIFAGARRRVREAVKETGWTKN